MNKNDLQNKYSQSRGNLLVLIVLTVVNIAILFTDMNTMFLFSFTIPYWFSAFAYFLELHTLYIVAAVFLIVYLACWFFSKKHFGWFIPALILFILDIVYLVYITIDMGEGGNIFDIVIHIWALYYLVMGIINGYKLKKLPDASISEDNTLANSTPLRLAEDVKHRVLLEADYNSHKICYRRTKGVNEFIIDNYVYGEYKKIVEFPHNLCARIDNLDICAGYDGHHSYIKVNGETIAKKTRLV